MNLSGAGCKSRQAAPVFLALNPADLPCKLLLADTACGGSREYSNSCMRRWEAWYEGC